jgi:short-subunit dehydrogenase
MKTAFITGGSSGIGASVGRELARRGWRVALAARRKDLLDQHVADIVALGGSAVAVVCDVTDAASVRSAVASVGTIDLALANAGVGLPGTATRFNLAEAELMMRTNFFGMLYLFDAVIHEMVARNSGHFAAVASLAGHRGLPGSSMYSASKAAMQTFLEASQIELRRSDVTVTTINPGFITTPMTDKNRFHMPFLMTVDEAARRIVHGLEKRKEIIEFPLPMSLVTRTMRFIPHSLFSAVTGGYGRRKVDASKAGR